MIFALAFLVRFVNLQFVKDHPFFVIPVGPDSLVYDYFASLIASGNWALDIPLCKTLKMSPLYPYILAVIYRVAGANFYTVRLVQIAAGAGGCVVTYMIVRRLLGTREAVLAALLQTFYIPLLFFEPRILNEVWVVFVNLLCVLFLYKADREGRWEWMGVAGLFLGLSAILRANALLFSPFIMIWLFWNHYRGHRLGLWLWTGVGLAILILSGVFPRYAIVAAILAAAVLAASRKLRANRVLLYSVVFYLGMELAIFPVTLRNYLIGREWVILTTNLGPELYMGSAPDAKGISYMAPDYVTPSPLLISEHFLEEARRLTDDPKLTYEDASRFWIKRTILEIVEQPRRFLALVGRKAYYYLNNFEADDNDFYDFERQYSPILSAPLPTLGIVFPAAILGMILLWPRGRELLLLYGMVGAYFASAMLAVVMGRYRLPSTPFLIMFASSVPFALLRMIRERRWAAVGLSAALLAGGLGFCFYKSPTIEQLASERYAVGYRKLAIRKLGQGKTREAAEAVKIGIVLLPQEARNFVVRGADYGLESPFAVAIEEYERRVCAEPTSAQLHGFLSFLYDEYGDTRGAIREIRKALEFEREDFSYAFFAAWLYLRQRGYDEARRVLDEIVFKKDPRSPLAHYYLGRIFECEAEHERRRGRAAEAEMKQRLSNDEYLAAARWRNPADQSNPENMTNWARHAYRLGRYRDAAAWFSVALNLRPQVAVRHFWLGMALHQVGEYDGALRHLQRAIQLDPDVQTGFAIEAGIVQLKKAIAEAPRDGTLHLKLAQLYLSDFRMREAFESAHRAAELLPGSTEPYKVLVKYYEIAGDETTAKHLCQAGLNLARDPFLERQHEKLSLSTQLDRPQDGAKYAPESEPEPFLRLAEMYWQDGQGVKALRTLRIAREKLFDKLCPAHRRLFLEGTDGHPTCAMACDKYRPVALRIFALHANIMALRENLHEARRDQIILRRLEGR